MQDIGLHACADQVPASFSPWLQGIQDGKHMRVALKVPRLHQDREHAQQQWLQAVASVRLRAAAQVQPSMLQAAEADTVKAAVAQNDMAAKARGR